MEDYVEHYNDIRLNSAIGYITPKDMLAGQVGGGEATAEESPPAGRVTDETEYLRLRPSRRYVS